MMYLDDPTYGRLDLHSAGGPCGPYVVSSIQVGPSAARPVVRDRALATGTDDQTRYVGAKAITLGVTINDNGGADPQAAVDALNLYQSPRLRPRLAWRIPNSMETRSALVRGTGGCNLVAQRWKHQELTVQWVVPSGVLEDETEQVLKINPSTDVEAGRTYDLVYDRQYPAGLGIGDRFAPNRGNVDADWSAVIFGPCTDPVLSINGVDIAFDENGGIALTGGTSLVLDTRTQTILLNGDPDASRYEFCNYPAWTWDDVRLRPGTNVVRYEGASIGDSSSVTFRYRSAWL